MRNAPIREGIYCYHGTLVWLKSFGFGANPLFPQMPHPPFPFSTPSTCPGGELESSVEHERCSSAWQGWRDSSSWMLASREEALKLAPACGARTGYRGSKEVVVVWGVGLREPVRKMKMGVFWRERNDSRQK